MKTYAGQHIYSGPMLPEFGLQHGTIFRNGIFPSLTPVIAECPAIGELIIPIGEYALARKQLNFDFARNMRGTEGKYVTFYQEVQNWLTQRKLAGVTAAKPQMEMR